MRSKIELIWCGTVNSLSGLIRERHGFPGVSPRKGVKVVYKRLGQIQITDFAPMNPRMAVLLASLAGNVLLGGLVLSHPSKLAPPYASRAVEGAAAPNRTREFLRSTETASTAPAAVEAPAFSWAQLESEDYQNYITALRAFGVPEKMVRDIIIADVQKLYRPRLAALRPKKQANTNFWENRAPFIPSAGQTKEQRQQLFALQKEQQELIKNLLGRDVYREIAKDLGQPDWTERMFGPMPEDLRDKVGEMQERFQQATSEIYSKADGFIDQDTQAELKAMRRKFRDELGTVLTPQQVQEYGLRNSDTANQMRWQLGTFEPNEKEFRAIFDYKQALEDLEPQRSPFDDSPRPSSEDLKARQQKQKELDQTLSEALGPDRLKEFKMLDQWEYRNLSEAGVSKSDLLKVADMKQQAQDAAARIRGDKSLSPEQRTQALQGVRTETERSLAELIGERRVKAYSGSGGYWLRNIAPKN